MSAALQPPTVTPEILAIIDQGSPKPQTQTAAIAIDAVKVQAAAPVAAQPETPQRSVKVKVEKDRGDANVATVTATYRLPSTIIPVLLKASSDRKIKNIQPFTQQGIVTEALTDWLKKNGFQV